MKQLANLPEAVPLITTDCSLAHVPRDIRYYISESAAKSKSPLSTLAGFCGQEEGWLYRLAKDTVKRVGY